jgi:hypothetical protein
MGTRIAVFHIDREITALQDGFPCCTVYLIDHFMDSELSLTADELEVYTGHPDFHKLVITGDDE